MKAWRKISDCERSNHGQDVLVFALRRRGFLRKSGAHPKAYATKRNPEAHAEAYATKASYGD
jgi:hypothetical protein